MTADEGARASPVCMIIAASAVPYWKGGLAMAKTVRVRITTNVRRIGNGTYQVRTTTSKGGSTKTTTRTVRAR